MGEESRGEEAENMGAGIFFWEICDGGWGMFEEGGERGSI